MDLPPFLNSQEGAWLFSTSSSLGITRFFYNLITYSVFLLLKKNLLNRKNDLFSQKKCDHTLLSTTDWYNQVKPMPTWIIYDTYIFYNRRQDGCWYERKSILAFIKNHSMVSSGENRYCKFNVCVNSPHIILNIYGRTPIELDFYIIWRLFMSLKGSSHSHLTYKMVH